MSLAFQEKLSPALRFLWRLSVCSASLAVPALAQYPGHIDTAKGGPPPLRATAVFEWTGTLQKPTASRLIPIAIFDGENYQPGGLYLAEPAPLAVESGTVYELEKTGTPEGLVDLDSAAKVSGEWIGLGKWHPEIAPPRPKLLASKNPPTVVKDADSDRPHFAHRPAPAAAGSGPESKPDTDTAKNTPPPVDPERPTLRRRPAQDAAKASTSQPEAPVTATANTDPDRPKLSYGRPENLETIAEPAKLEGTPADLKQMVAISDVKEGEPHPFVYQWADPADAAKMKSAMEVLAQKAVATQQSAQQIGTPEKKTVKTRSVRSKRRKPAAAPAKPPLPALMDESFQAYELSYSGGATLVFTAKTADANDPKYVTLIAQPDFYGNPRVLFQQVTSEDMLDITPRMGLIDAVDTDGDNRAELIFELRGKTQRQFAIYRVTGGEAEQVFVTDPLP